MGRRLVRAAALLVVCAFLWGCGTGAIGDGAVEEPQRAGWDLSIDFCGLHACPDGPATAAEVDAVEVTLEADPDIVSVARYSPEDVAAAAGEHLAFAPEEATVFGPRLSARLASGSDVRRVATRYLDASGVAVVVAHADADRARADLQSHPAMEEPVSPFAVPAICSQCLWGAQVSLFLCDGRTCPEPTTGRVAALRAALSHDPDVASFTFESKEEAYARLSELVPDLASAIEADVLPATYRLVVDPLDAARVAGRYAAAPGVEDVTDHVAMAQESGEVTALWLLRTATVIEP